MRILCVFCSRISAIRHGALFTAALAYASRCTTTPPTLLARRPACTAHSVEKQAAAAYRGIAGPRRVGWKEAGLVVICSFGEDLHRHRTTRVRFHSSPLAAAVASNGYRSLTLVRAGSEAACVHVPAWSFLRLMPSCHGLGAVDPRGTGALVALVELCRRFASTSTWLLVCVCCLEHVAVCCDSVRTATRLLTDLLSSKYQTRLLKMMDITVR